MIFSPWLARVDQRWRVPANSVIFTVGFTVVMSLINIGSLTAFNAFLSVSVVALMATYTLSVACIFVKRLRGEPLPPARWSFFGKNAAVGSTTGGLGRFGPLINAIALLYSLWAFFWGFWPLFNNPTPASVSETLSALDTQANFQQMNWAVVIFAGVMTIAGVAFVAHARKTYEGPVMKVQKVDVNLVSH